MSKPNIYDYEFSKRMDLIAEKKFNGNYSEFARAIGVSQPSLTRWIKGEADTSRTNLIKIAEAANVSVEWLITGNGEMMGVPLCGTIPQLENDVVMIPCYKSILVSAGFGSFNDGITKPDGEEPYSELLLKTIGIKPKDAAVFWAKGNSMEPVISNGDQLLIDRSKKEIKSNKIYLIQNESSIWVKRVKLLWDRIELISDNKEEYAPISLTSADAGTLKVIGQVAYIGKTVV